MQFEVFYTKNHSVGLKVCYKDNIYEGERELYLCSKSNPQTQAERWAKQNYNKNIKVFIVYGLGLGYHILELQQLLDNTQRIIVVESNKLLLDLEEIKLLKAKIAALSQVEIITLESIRQFYAIITQYEQSDLLCYRPSLQIIPPELREMREALENYCLNRYAKNRFIEEIEKNYSFHEGKTYDNITTYYGRIVDKPIVIVSAGPSLSTQLKKLKAIEDYVFIFATGRVLKMLIQAGIRVDMFCIIDAQELTYKQIEGLENLSVPFVFLNTVCEKTVKAYQGPKLCAYSMDFEEGTPGRIETGGSVATAVLSLAIEFGTRYIAFLGQDLGYTHNQTHAKECGGRVVGIERMRKVKAIDGSYIPTTAGLISFKKWIEWKIRKTKGVEFFNCSTQGAYIEGCQHMDLLEFLKVVEEK